MLSRGVLRCVTFRSVLRCVLVCVVVVVVFFLSWDRRLSGDVLIKDRSGTGQALLVHFTHTSDSASVDISNVCSGVDHGNTGSCLGYGLDLETR